MIDPHNFYLASVVSQATFALTLALLAWTDRRSRGLVWLAAACGLHLVAILLLPLWRGTGRWVPEAASASLLILIFFLIHVGLRLFITRRKLRLVPVVLPVGAGMVLVAVSAPLSTLWSMQLARAGAVVIMAITINMLWRARIAALRGPARAAAALLITISVLFLFRLPLEPLRTAPPVLLLARDATMLCTTLLALSFIAMFVAESKRRLHDETRLDALTGLRNRRAMEEMAAHGVGVAARTGRPLTLLMMDLDSFKLLNDTWGHSLGDRALRAVGGVLLTIMGGDDTVARMGGEEFAVLLPGRSVTMAQAVAERIRGTVAGLRLNEGERLASFTVSIGVGALHAGETDWTEMLRRSDVALYRAKREGRNRVVVCAEATQTAPERGAAGTGERRNRSAAAERTVRLAEVREPSQSSAMLR